MPARINAWGRPALIPLTAPLSVHLLRNTNRGTLTADAEGLHRGRTTIVGDVRVRRLLLNTNFDLFGDFEEFDEPTVDWRNTFSFRLTGALSVDYRLDVLDQPRVTDDTQLTQNLLFRYSWGN